MITDNQIKLMIGSLLHDIGKVVYRSGDGRNHSQSGYEYLKTEAGITDEVILNCVKYHHGNYLKNAKIAADDLAYITYYADNIAAFSDRRDAENRENGFDKNMPLDSVFNILNGNCADAHYSMQVLDPSNGINYPTDKELEMNASFYKSVIQNITDNLKGIDLEEEYLNSLLSVLEANLSYIPSSTSKQELADISLYDHVKMTAAVASCVQQYLDAKKEKNYKDCLFVKAKESYEEEMFLLYSLEISGSRNFIYTVGEKGVLKGLRARTFYLEILLEHIVDELLEELFLSRSNLIYTGGGHCYLLLPNTVNVKTILENNEKKLNGWLMEQFDTALYAAGGYAVANANALRNMPDGSYAKLYSDISGMVEKKKVHRYDADMIRRLNHKKHDGERECVICRRIRPLKDEKCAICTALEKFSGNILQNDYFTVMCKPEQNALPLPGQRYLVADTKESLLKRMKDDYYVRCYTKNNIYTGKHVTTKLWVGDYNAGEKGDTFEKLAKQAEGVERIAVLRADVDNLEEAFVHGFERNGDRKYVTLSRTATLSRQISLFFKCYINRILGNGEESIFSGQKERNVVIIYSGGNEVFLAGAWNDVMAAFMDLKEAWSKFSLGTLTISGGIGIYQPKHPLNVMAGEVEKLMWCAKNTSNKNAVTIFEKDQNYPWEIFQKKIIKEKLQTLTDYFENTDEQGMTFLYHLTELLRNSGESINIARYVYLLSRMEPEDSSGGNLEAYQIFSKKMYEWSKTEEEKRELITAIYLYVYLHRKREEEQ